MGHEEERLHRALGRRLRELRKARQGVSQERLATEAGLHSTFVARVERGETGVTVDSVTALCGALGISLAEFFEPFARPFEIRGPRRRRR
jgi:transcriptional regulator with XRE-family HTH domain